GEDHAKRIERHETVAGLGLDRLPREKSRRVLCVEVARERAFLRFRDAIEHRLAHFSCHEMRKLARLGAEDLGCSAHWRCAFGKWNTSPLEKGFVDLAYDRADASRGHLVICAV